MPDFDDRLNMTIHTDLPELRGGAALAPVLEILARSIPAEPVQMHVTDRKETSVAGFLDPKIHKALDRRKHAVQLFGQNRHDEVLFNQTPRRLTVVILTSGARVSDSPSESISALFTELIGVLRPVYGRCHLDRHAQHLHEQHYRHSRRTFFASGLYWLNYFGEHELKRQGGEGIRGSLDKLANVRTELIHQGLLVQVGDRLTDAATDKGTQLLVSATSTLPPMDQQRTPAQTSVVDGVHGFHDAVDGGFWVSKNIGAEGRIAARAIKELAALVGKGNPPIQKVHVLFSREQSARNNAAQLTAADIGAWYIDLRTGKPTAV